jgi:drug/metabolite transporter (DMT)-like permease
MMFAYVQVMSRYEGKNLIVRRLRRQQILGAVLLVFAGVLMFVTKHNEWVLCLTVAAILELYTAFRIPSELEKEK